MLRLRSLIIASLFVFNITSAFSQQTSIGFNLNLQQDLEESDVQPSVGFTFEKPVAKRFSIESGLYSRREITYMMTTVYDGMNYQTYHSKFGQYFLSIPLLLKYHSKYFNLAAGPAADIYVGWRQLGKNREVVINSVKRSDKVTFDILAKISKAFRVRNYLILEPELRLNMPTSYEGQSAGLGLSARFPL